MVIFLSQTTKDTHRGWPWYCEEQQKIHIWYHDLDIVSGLEKCLDWIEWHWTILKLN